MKQYSFFAESTRTFLKHADALKKSAKGRLLLQKASDQMKHGKDAAKKLSELDKLRSNVNAGVKRANLEIGARDSVAAGIKRKHGKQVSVSTHRKNGKTTISVDK